MDSILRDPSRFPSTFPPAHVPLPLHAFVPIVARASDGSPYLAGNVFGSAHAVYQVLPTITGLPSLLMLLSLWTYLAVSPSLRCYATGSASSLVLDAGLLVSLCAVVRLVPRDEGEAGQVDCDKTIPLVRE